MSKDAEDAVIIRDLIVTTAARISLYSDLSIEILRRNAPGLTTNPRLAAAIAEFIEAAREDI